MSEFKLFEEIIILSKINNWEDARKEWFLYDVEFVETPQTCLCTHYPIKQLCYMKNIKNSCCIIVGNCCVDKFFDIKSSNIFNSLKKIFKNIKKSANKDLISFCYQKNIINLWEHNFYLNIMRKRKLSQKQIDIKFMINNKILIYFKR
jgi:hypothetical protein